MKGKDEDIELGKIEIAKKMKDAGRSFKESTEFPGLTAETIERL
jgi:hypothetical protein